MALVHAVRTYEPTLPGIAAFLQTKDLFSLLTVLERKALEGDEEGGRREETFRPWASTQLIERFTSQCVELKLKDTPKYRVGSVAVHDFGDDVTRRLLNGIHGAIQAVPLWFPSEATEFVTADRILKKKKVVMKGVRFVVTNRTATDGEVDFFVPSVPCRVTVSSASQCSGEACQMTSLLLCFCCGEGLRGCGQCASVCPSNEADCLNDFICPDCCVFAPEEADTPGVLAGCLDCHFKCAACNLVSYNREKAQCDNEACPHAFPGNTCAECAELADDFVHYCRKCKIFKCDDCESMIHCGCGGTECRSCAELRGEILLCCECGSPGCSECIKFENPCSVCGKRKCQECEESYDGVYFEDCERCGQRCCSDCMTRCAFDGCQGQSSSLCKSCPQDKETCHKCGARACLICQEYGWCDWYEDDNYDAMHCEHGDTDADYAAALRKMGHCSRCDKFFCPVSCNRYCDTCQAGVCEACLPRRRLHRAAGDGPHGVRWKRQKQNEE